MLLGEVYLKIAQREGKKDFSFVSKNIGFLIRNVPFAHRKAEKHFTEAVETVKEIGSNSVLAQLYLDLGRLRRSKGKYGEARRYMADAARLFEECEADAFLKQAREELASLPP